ncbi:ribonuclease P protein subunit p29 [Latimeria chalumnae]|uniref:Ribonuclease P protein subunit p29 n=1 Tax=Latimeria chalumnae TaxID=7897 RepID=H3AJB1_LATCH|nr:PREDICTED: ribonuclease P protein subunit p29 [Latimeria chalumnae]|eukprot:XP_006008745.1 PREDICTED: ribonuclease P protein subunit p29 [Latimeria chalumnae]
MRVSDVVYSQLPVEEAKRLDIQPQGSKQAEAFVNAFLNHCMPRQHEEVIQEKLKRKALVLKHHVKKEKKQKQKKVKTLSARQRKEMRLFEIRPEHQRYEMFLPLHELWKQYIRNLCNGLKPDSQPQMIQSKLLKADFHGAVVTVAKSKCSSYVGVTGIILQEMKHVFKILTRDDKLKVILKRGSVFSVEIDGFVSYIFGSNFQLRSSERSAKKFKVKGSIDL